MGMTLVSLPYVRRLTVSTDLHPRRRPNSPRLLLFLLFATRLPRRVQMAERRRESLRRSALVARPRQISSGTIYYPQGRRQSLQRLQSHRCWIHVLRPDRPSLWIRLLRARHHSWIRLQSHRSPIAQCSSLGCGFWILHDHCHPLRCDTS